jgi:hypothetical protein
MVNDIVRAVKLELEFIFGGEASILQRSNFKNGNWPSYKMPLITIHLQPGDESQQMLGGWTMEDWRITLSVYTHTPDLGGTDPTSFSDDQLEIIEQVQTAFSDYAVFNTAEMQALQPNYGTRWTYMGKTEAEALEHPDGLCLGMAIHFDTISLYEKTTGFVCTTPLSTITEINPPANTPSGQ